ncbi:hypothetical protein Micbo1qcDRAFT_209091 [Microdochium bolleyi]|uniref:Uncharacterized protein n=1 Tax=Microdochium bolleyi TaxID=196109 RepID=A0A136ING7_9PEZI|nr:hypothetical protein Micbo1qcDRAFT_209091 [Microdochium bolleyi]
MTPWSFSSRFEQAAAAARAPGSRTPNPANYDAEAVRNDGKSAMQLTPVQCKTRAGESTPVHRIKIKSVPATISVGGGPYNIDIYMEQQFGGFLVGRATDFGDFLAAPGRFGHYKMLQYQWVKAFTGPGAKAEWLLSSYQPTWRECSKHVSLHAMGCENLFERSHKNHHPYTVVVDLDNRMQAGAHYHIEIRICQFENASQNWCTRAICQSRPTRVM